MEQFFLCIHMIRILRQESQQIKLFCGKVLLFTIHPDPPGCLIYFQAAYLDYFIFLMAAVHQPLVTGQMSLHPRDHLAGAEGFCHIIVRTKTQAPDFINIVLFRRHHNDGGIFIFPHLAADLKSCLLYTSRCV